MPRVIVPALLLFPQSGARERCWALREDKILGKASHLLENVLTSLFTGPSPLLIF